MVASSSADRNGAINSMFRIAMHGIHVHGDPRGPCVIARVNQHTGNCSVIEFPASHYAVIAAEYLVHALRASTHHDGRDESVALDGSL